VFSLTFFDVFFRFPEFLAEIYAGFATCFHVCSVCFSHMFSMISFCFPEFHAEIYASFVWVLAGVSHVFFFSDV